MPKLLCFKGSRSSDRYEAPLDPEKRRVKSEMEEQRRHSEELDRQLKEWNKQDRNTTKLLLLGTGESGKSTFTKQMKIIHVKDGITDEEKMDVVSIIRSNLRDAIQCLCLAMGSLQLSLHDPDKQPHLDYILTGTTLEDWLWTEEFYDSITPLWKDPGFQECYRRSNEFQLIDSAKYFLERVDEIRKPDYKPTDQDVLRSREVTTNIQLIKFSVPYRSKKVDFHLYDAGGQQGERRKWIQVFQNATAILFIVDSSSYDCRVRENPSKNRLMEAIEIFDQVWNNNFLQNVHIYLFLNKIDLLEENSRKGRLFDAFVDEVDQSHPTYDFVQGWHDWKGPTDKEAREFIKAYPTLNSCEAVAGSSPDIQASRRRSAGGGMAHSKSRASARRMSVVELLQDKNIHQNTVKTAVFLKKLFLHVLSNPISRKHPQSQDRGCQTFYTCAVDTDTVKKVFNACKASLTDINF